MIKKIPYHKDFSEDFYNLIDVNKLYIDLAIKLKEEETYSLQEAINVILYDENLVNNLINDKKFNYNMVSHYEGFAKDAWDDSHILSDYDLQHFVLSFVLDEVIFIDIGETLCHNIISSYANEKYNFEISEIAIEMILQHDIDWCDTFKEVVDKFKESVDNSFNK